MAASPESQRTCDDVRDPKVRGRVSAEMILGRCAALPKADQAFIRAVYLHQQSTEEVARVQGTSGRSVRRRLKAILQRACSREFVYVLGHRHEWPEERRRIGTAIFVQGLTTRRAAADLGLSYHQVRREKDAIAALCAAHALRVPAAPTDALGFLKGVRP